MLLHSVENPSTGTHNNCSSAQKLSRFQIAHDGRWKAKSTSFVSMSAISDWVNAAKVCFDHVGPAGIESMWQGFQAVDLTAAAIAFGSS